jgi:hypothetical protein
MKKLIIPLTAAALLIGIMFSGCQHSQRNKVEDAAFSADEAQIKLENAQSELTLARQEYYEDYMLFKKENDAKTRLNELAIAELKIMIAQSSEQNKPVLERELAALEKKNHDLKTALETYNKSGTDNWERFKSEFKDSMNDLGQAVGDLVSKAK